MSDQHIVRTMAASARTSAQPPTHVTKPKSAKDRTLRSLTTIIVDAQPPFSEFTVFPKLPLELQLMVWRKCIVPRIVTLKPEKVPAILHVCADSRAVAIRAKYQIHIRDMSSGIITNPFMDILLLDSNSFSTQIGYHVNSMHTLKCRGVKRATLKCIQRLAFSVKEVLEIWKSQCFHCFLLVKLEELFPGLKELIIILRPGCEGTDYEDLYEVDDINNEFLKTVVKDVKGAFENAQKEGSCQDMELKFMRNEKWVT